MMGGVSPETCLASYKYGIISFDTLLHFVQFFCMNCTLYVSFMHRNFTSAGTSGVCCGIKHGDKANAPALRSEIKTRFRVQILAAKNRTY
jgi:hypothetical protein